MSDKRLVSCGKTRSGRLRHAPKTFTPSKVNGKVTVKSTNYALNKKKAISKKLEAAQRAYDVTIEDKSGTLVLAFSAAAYEVFKHKLVCFYQSLEGYVVIPIVKHSIPTDNSTTVVEESYSVCDKLTKSQKFRINLFHTTCKVDVNGKQYDEFIRRHLPAVLEMLASTTNLQLVNDKLRDLCERYLNKCQTSNTHTQGKQTSLAICDAKHQDGDHSAVPTTQAITQEDYKCRVCRRNSQSRAIQCDQCRIWVHYRCEKLTDTEINKLESTCTPYYCRKCQISNKSTVSTQLVLPVKSSLPTSAITAAEKILDDEVECDVCIQSIDSDHDSVKCDKCGNRCHTTCTNRSDDYTLCTACCATQENAHQQQSADTSDVHPTQTIDLTVDKGNNAVKSSACTSGAGKPGVDSDILVSDKGKDVCVIKADKQPTGKPNVKTNISNRQNAAEGKSETNIRMQDVRAREEKLRKREEELKQREAAIRETENRQKHLETYIERVEARNQELEKTIRILRRRLSVCELNEDEKDIQTSSIHQPTHTVNTKRVNSTVCSSSSETLVQQMHEKVSQFVLKKIDNELNLLLNAEDNGQRDTVSGNSDIHTLQYRGPPQAPLFQPSHNVQHVGAPMMPSGLPQPPAYQPQQTVRVPHNVGGQPPMYGYMNNVHTGQPPVFGSTNNVHNVHGQPLIYSNTNPGRQEQPQHQHFLWERPKIRPFQ